MGMGFWNGSQDSALGQAMVKYLVNFAKSGDPNGSGLQSWEMHTTGSGRFMDLGPELAMQECIEQAAARYSFLGREYFGKRLLTQVPLSDAPESKRQRLEE